MFTQLINKKVSMARPKIFCLFYVILVLLLSELGYSQEAEIAKFPTRPITFISSLPPGTNSDNAIRLVSKEAEKYLGQPIVVVNKPGASNTLGPAAVAIAKPDGYTIGFDPFGAIFLAPLLQKVPYDPINDFTHIMQFMGFNQGVAVRADSVFKSFKDVIAYARQNPKKLIYAAPVSSLNNFTMKKIARQEKVELTLMPVASGYEAEMALLGKHIDVACGDFNPSLIEGGQTRLLLLFKDERSNEYPQTPILKDLGYDTPYTAYGGVLGPKGMPEGIVKKIEEAYTKAMKEPAFIKGMKENFYLPIVYRNNKELTEYVVHHIGLYKKLIEEVGLSK
jgi:tripartite-type tricarboxylate transporter receptor subunit TctC